MNFELFYDCSTVSIDTRNIAENSLFICLKGEHFDGNDFALDALQKGAKYVVVDREELADNKSIFFVSDTLIYLQELARFHRRKMKIPVIGITGSNGKTSSKELIAAVLHKKYKVLATLGNLNNHIGVPLTLLRLTKQHEIAIVEMGANKLKDIEELCQIAEPTHGIITNIGKAHLQGFKDFEGVLKTKTELYQAVEKVGGTLFYNEEDPVLKNALPSGVTAYSYGSTEASSLFGRLIKMDPFVHFSWTFGAYKSPELSTKMVGRYNFLNFLAAACIGAHFEVEASAISEALISYVPSNNRSQIMQTESNTLLLDAYNANPSSMEQAIDSFVLMESAQKAMILGDMFELGEESSVEHAKLVAKAVELPFASYFVGKHFYGNRKESDQMEFFETKEDLLVRLKALSLKDHLILIKGSRGIGLETIVDHL